MPVLGDRTPLLNPNKPYPWNLTGNSLILRRIISQLWPRQYLILSLLPPNPFCTDVVISIASAVTRNIPRQFLSALYPLVHNVDLYTKPSFYIHPRTKDRRANLTEFMLARVITFVGIPENLVGDRGSIFLPYHGRPCVTIKAKLCGTCSLHCRAIFHHFSTRRLCPSAPGLNSPILGASIYEVTLWTKKFLYLPQTR
jgi:hypothetical protein